MQKILIFDASENSQTSLKKALQKVGKNSDFIQTATQIQQVQTADKIIFAKPVFKTQAINFSQYEFLPELKTQIAEKPGLFIDANFALFALDVIAHAPTKFNELSNTTNQETPICHIGWNLIEKGKKTQIFSADDEEFYFAHADFITKTALPETSRFLTSYFNEQEFVAGFEIDKIVATQFLPHKSGDKGLELLQKFINS